MAYRYRYFDQYGIIARVESDVDIEIGDLVGLVAGSPEASAECVVLPASDSSFWDTDMATSQAIFHDAFIGVSRQNSLQTDLHKNTEIRVATEGVFEYPFDQTQSGTGICIGDYLGPMQNATPDGLLSQELVEVSTCDLMVGRCWKHEESAAETVLCRIFPRIACCCEDGEVVLL